MTITDNRKKISGHYDDHPYVKGGDPRISRWGQYLKSFMGETPEISGPVIDLGCGPGEISRALLDICPETDLICVDISETSLRHCGALNPDAKLILASALKLPIPDGHFSFTLAIGSLHHTGDCKAAIDEAIRITKPGGRLLIFLYSKWSIYHFFYCLYSPVRRLVPLAKFPTFLLNLIQPLAWMHFGHSLPVSELKSLIADKLYTPFVEFHSRQTVKAWAANSLKLISLQTFFMGYAITYYFEKRPVTHTPPHPGVAPLTTAPTPSRL